MEEIWKDIAGYEGKYQVSNLGRVRSLSRISTSRNASGEYQYKTKEKILRTFTQRGGYQRVSFGKGKDKKAFMVHRLVGMAFVPGYREGLFVNHKDENPHNNRADNLEWVTTAENNIYGNHIKNSRRYVAVEQLTIDGQFIQRFNSIIDAAEATGCRATSIQNCCAGRYKSSCGYRWRHAQ
jgi:hypothetical protein